MKIIAFSAAGLVILSGIALAQEQPAPPPPPPSASFDAGPMDDAPPPPPRGPGRHGERGPMGGHGPVGGRDGERPPPPPSKAAHLRLEKGDLKLDVKCAEDEPMKACADIAMQLLDRATPKP